LRATCIAFATSTIAPAGVRPGTMSMVDGSGVAIAIRSSAIWSKKFSDFRRCPLGSQLLPRYRPHNRWCTFVYVAPMPRSCHIFMWPSGRAT
jgi:hypothetical protein